MLARLLLYNLSQLKLAIPRKDGKSTHAVDHSFGITSLVVVGIYRRYRWQLNTFVARGSAGGVNNPTDYWSPSRCVVISP